eukprot:283774-Lingulodinium_polyedra.AAC.1
MLAGAWPTQNTLNPGTRHGDARLSSTRSQLAARGGPLPGAECARIQKRPARPPANPQSHR